jgi:Bacterial extracellular solute-binding protein
LTRPNLGRVWFESPHDPMKSQIVHARSKVTRMRDALTCLLFAVFVCGLAVVPCHAERTQDGAPAGVELTVAVAAELNPAITEVGRAFEAKTGNPVRVISGDSATLYSQIRNGEPIDAFFPADMNDVRRLTASGAAMRGSTTEYARDELALCISPMVRAEFPLKIRCWALGTKPSFRSLLLIRNTRPPAGPRWKLSGPPASTILRYEESSRLRKTSLEPRSSCRVAMPVSCCFP